jgi:hypothetical protein
LFRIYWSQFEDVVKSGDAPKRDQMGMLMTNVPRYFGCLILKFEPLVHDSFMQQLFFGVG